MKLKIAIITILLTAIIMPAVAGVVVGAARPDIYLPILNGKRVALLSNHTGMADSATHTLDALIANGVKVTTILSPEHGFRGTADAGETVSSGKDAATGIPVISLYAPGKSSRLTPQLMKGFDAVVVDMQDVGTRDRKSTRLNSSH